MKYLLINVLLIVFHALMFFIGAMGFGGRSGNESTGELVYNILLFGAFGAAPNLLVFVISLIMKKDIKQNAIWTIVFALIVITGYFYAFWTLLEL